MKPNVSARMPPGFMNAICAPPRLAGASPPAGRRRSRRRAGSRRARSPCGFRMSAVILPITWLASGADAVTYCLHDRGHRGSSFDGSSDADVDAGVPG